MTVWCDTKTKYNICKKGNGTLQITQIIERCENNVKKKILQQILDMDAIVSCFVCDDTSLCLKKINHFLSHRSV